MRVLLVVMPFGAIESPMLGVSTIKAHLRRDGIACDIAYLNMDFARAAGLRAYQHLCETAGEVFAGEWVFSEALFGSNFAKRRAYIDEVVLPSGALTPEAVRSVVEMAKLAPSYLSHCLRSVAWDRYDVVGFTSMFEQNLASLALAKRVKERHPRLRVVMGGANAAGPMGMELARRFPFLDAVFTGEADHSFPEYLRRLCAGQPVAGLPGVSTAGAPQSPPRAPVEAMDCLPYPNFEDFFPQANLLGPAAAAGRALLMETSRGCWWGQKHQCRFCGLNSAEIGFRSKSPARALDEILHLVASPRDGFWSQILPGEAVQGTARFLLRALLSHGGYDWGHRLLGIRAVQRIWRGRGVRVAIVDSGISKEQDDLKPAGGVDTLDAEDPKSWDVDEKGHGTHVAGIVASLDTKAGLLGGAPDAETFSVKVLPGGHLSDLVEAIEWCIAERMDVVNLSLGSRTFSEVLAGALRDAYDRGMTCVAAAGNESGSVAFPASAPTVIAVGAVGKYGTFPEDSAHALCATELADRRGELFAAAFSNSGPEVALCAPGVAVLSTVPTGYSAWDGTSAAAPFVTSLAALVLEAYPHLRTGDEVQPEAVREVLRASAFDLGLPPEIQGAGLPSAIRALRAATPRRFAASSR